MFESKFISSYPREIIAVDEVGRGPLSGPVVIGAVRVLLSSEEDLLKLTRSLRARGIKDSKKIRPTQRAVLLKKFEIPELTYKEVGIVTVKDLEVSFVTWEISHEAIDQENILAASLRGMKEAGLYLSKLNKDQTTIFIDGNQKLRWGSEVCPWEEITVIEGDSKSTLIGLASIIAKEKRDSHMREMHEIYPQYGFNTHFGYGTLAHRKAIEEHGPCPIHRKTFGGVREHLRA